MGEGLEVVDLGSVGSCQAVLMVNPTVQKAKQQQTKKNLDFFANIFFCLFLVPPPPPPFFFSCLFVGWGGGIAFLFRFVFFQVCVHLSVM